MNRKAAKVWPEELVLTESVLDALSLIAAGVENALPCYGTNGFTDEHLAMLKDAMTKTVVLAFDNDSAGKQGAEKLKERLVAEGFAVKIIVPGKEGLERGTVCRHALAKDAVRAKIDAAEAFKTGTKPMEAMETTRDGPYSVYRLEGTSYRLSGVKEMFVSSLKVNVKAERETLVYYDSLDLYSARGRAAYSNSLGRLFDLEPARIERDLVLILEHLEAERNARLASSVPARETMTEEDRRLGMEFLTSPAMFDQIVRDMETLGYVGEDLNKKLLYICASSRKLDEPMSVIILSQSAAGKSYLVETVRKLMPPEDVVAVTSLSDQALNYVEDMMHKFLILGEAVHSEVVEHQIREMLSARELSRLVTTKDEKTGKMASRLVRTPAVTAAVMSSTNQSLNPENASRCFIVNADETRVQTRRIHDAQRRKYELSRYEEKKSLVPEIVRKHQAAQRLLDNVAVVNEIGRYLDFPDAMMRTRRDHERFMDLIACVCFLRQFLKERKEKNGLRFIECDFTDYEIAYGIMVNGILSSTMAEIPRSAMELYEALRELARKEAADAGVRANEVTFTQREIRERTGFGQSWVRANLRTLVEFEYVALSRGNNRGERAHYRLKEDASMTGLDLSMIPTPDRMRELLSASTKSEQP